MLLSKGAVIIIAVERPSVIIKTAIDVIIMSKIRSTFSLIILYTHDKEEESSSTHIAIASAEKGA